MSEETQVEKLAAAALEALNRRDAPALVALSHPEYEFRSRLIGVEPTVYSGPRGFDAYFRDLEESFKDAAWDLEEVISAPDTDMSVVVFRFSAIGKESGVPFDLLTYLVWELREGKPFRNIVFASRDEALEAAGLSE